LKEVAMTTRTTPPVATGINSGSGVTASNSILHQISHTYFELMAAFERHLGMSRARWAILSRLDSQACLTQAALAQVLGVDAAAITRQVKQLEAEGLVTRWSAPEDNRFTAVALTPQGRDFVRTQRGVRDEFERIATAGLSDEQIEQLRGYLVHMRRNVEGLSAEE
jgi:DNA-binding MarR family transcriptional regulator